MVIEYSIDDIFITQTDTDSRIALSGWCLSDDGSIPELRAYVNDEISSLKVIRYARFDAYSGFEQERKRKKLDPYTGEVREKMVSNAGFVAGVKYEGKVKKFDLTAQAGTKGKTLCHLDRLHIDQIAHTGSIMYRIEKVDFSRNDEQYTVEGWFYSLLHENVVLQVRDEQNQVVKTDTETSPKKSMLSDVLMEHDDEMTGFRITFSGAEDKSYHLCLIANDDVVKYRFSSPKVVTEQNHKKNRFLKKAEKFIETWKNDGPRKALVKVHKALHRDSYYDQWFRTHRVSEEELTEQAGKKFPYMPKISLLVPTYNTPEKLLREMIETVIHQSYSNWELCIADGSDEKSAARDIIHSYADQEPRIKVTYLKQNYGISGNTNKALSLATGDYIALYDHDDFLELNALYEVVRAINEQKCDILYTDEDKYSMRHKHFEDPNLKPDFSIDLLRSHNYITHLFVVKASIIKEIGGFRSAFDGSQDYDLILRCVEKTDRIYHLPKILYHWRMHAGSTAEDPESKMYCYIAGQHALEEHLQRLHIDGRVEMMPKPYYGLYHVIYTVHDDPLVSVIIPNYENKDVLKTCVDSLFQVNVYKNIEIIIVENNSKSPELFAYYKELEQQHDNVHVVTWSGGSFNFSAINNLGVKYAKGKYLLFLNNDTEMINPHSIEEMVGMMQREEVGVVGAKLLYANDTVQHAGVIIGFGGTAGHVFHAIEKDAPGFMMRAMINCDYSAVTGACMMVKKDLFEKVGGFDENLAVAFNDIDLCLKIRELNKLVVYNAFSLWHHYESISRGYEDSPEKKARFEKESALFRQKWKKILIEGDPYYNANFDVSYTPFELH